MTRALFDLKDFEPQGLAVRVSLREASDQPLGDAWDEALPGTPEDRTPAEMCIVPLLREMRWQGNDRLLFEALPHFDRVASFNELRAVLARLNIQTVPISEKRGRVWSTQLPCIRIIDDDVQILMSRASSGSLRAYSGRQRGPVTIEPKDLGKSELYLVHETTEDDRQADKKRSWFSRVTRQFRTSILSILAMGFVLNMLALGPPLFIMAIYDRAMGAKAIDVLITLGIGLSIIVLTEIAMRRTRSKLQAYLGGRIDSIVGNTTFERILHLPYSMLSEAPIGTQVMRLRYFESVRDLFQSSLFNAITDLPFSVIFILAIFLIGGPVAAPPLILLGIYAFLAVYVLPKVQLEVSSVGEQKSKLNSFMIETFRNQSALRNMAADDVWLDRFSVLSANFNRLNIRARHLTHVLQIVSQTLMTICGILVLGIGAISVMNADMSLGALIATMALSWRVLNPMNQAFLSITQLAQSRSVIEQINNLMRVQLERQPGHLPKITREMQGDLEISSLVLRYPGATEAALKGLDFTVRNGEVLAITGPSGSGKTALFQAITGLFQPQVGSILYDGLDVRQLDPAEWRSSIGYAPDDLDFFYGTVKQNLKLADPGARDQDLVRVCDELGLLEYLSDQFDGMDTRLNGEVLQRIPKNMQQRIVLARAFIKKAPLYLLDNPGTHLDFEGDKQFIKYIENLRGQATIILSTQRPSHMKVADRVAVMKGGKIAMAGAPDQIIPVIMGANQKAKAAS